MYHVELRKFPNTACAFNLDENELRAIVEPWSRDRWIEVGERKWSPFEAQLTVLEGPHLAVEDLAMGRGWGNAQRHGEDVTERVLARARTGWESAKSASASASADSVAAEAQSPGGAAFPATTAPATTAPAAFPAATAPAATAPAAFPAANAPATFAELERLLGEDPAALLAAWRLAAERRPELSPSEALALAERTLGALDAER